MKKTNIPHFGLYGESGWIDDPEFFHIEDIESRSGNLGWKINAHRHSHLFQILIIKSGGAKIKLDEQQQNLLGSWVIIVPAGVVHSFQFAPDTDGRVITIATSMIDSIDQEKTARYISPLLKGAGNISFNGQQSMINELWPFIVQLEKEAQFSREGRSLMCEYLIKAILLLLRRQQQISGDPNTESNTQHYQIQALKDLIEQHYKEHWSSQNYADQLGFSLSRLNRASKAVLKQSVHDLIQDRLLLEAKRNLLYTARSIEEIAYDLGFKDPGYFSRFFKRTTGYPPGRFRAVSNQPAS